MLRRPLPRAEIVWIVALGGPALLDYWCDLGEPDSDTLSEHIRSWFHVETPAGKAAFTLALTAGTTWFYNHILKEVT